MKRILLTLVLLSASLIADTNNVPDTAVLVTTETVVKTVSREPRTVTLTFADDGTLSAQIDYETVTRVGGVTVSRFPLKTSFLSWQQVTNLMPSLATGLEEFKIASKASLTNTP